MPFLPAFLLLIVVPAVSVVAFCVYLEHRQRDFERRHPGRQFGIDEFNQQLAPVATCIWVGLLAVVLLAVLVLRLHDRLG